MHSVTANPTANGFYPLQSDYDIVAFRIQKIVFQKSEKIEILENL